MTLRQAPDSMLLILFCTLAGLSVPAPAAEPLGRLFFTPEQRAALDVARSKKTRVNLETDTGAEKPPPPPAPEVITYGGIVRRSDGKATIWLNNRAINDKDVRPGGTIIGKVRPDGSVTLQSAQSGHNVELKVGQRADLLSGEIEEGYARRGVTAPKPELKPEPAPAARTGADANAASPEAAERAREERERRRDIEDATRALQDAAAKIGTIPPPPPPPAPLHTGPTPPSPSQQPSR